MNNFKAVGIAEGYILAEDQDETLAAWQHLVDTGLAWRLQGFFGRIAADLINQGLIQPAGGAE
jgi:hypothetical protein